jgi:hypothetical protein
VHISQAKFRKNNKYDEKNSVQEVKFANVHDRFHLILITDCKLHS